MYIRSALVMLGLTAAIGCSTSTDLTGLSPISDGPQLARDASGVKPPPPLGTGDTEIFIDVGPSDVVDLSGGPSAESSEFALSFSARVLGTYFANTESTNGWIRFESTGDVVASQGARLQYDEKHGRTTGHGTLTDQSTGAVLYLELIEITMGSFGSCSEQFQQFVCANVSFTYSDDAEGTLIVFLGSIPS